MEKKLMPKFECKAPQFVDFDVSETSNIDNYFTSRDSLSNYDNIKINEEIDRPSDNDERINSKTENLQTPSNPAIESIKKDYRVTLFKTLSSPSINSTTTTYESPEFEYARPWLNETPSSLISAMSDLQLNSTSSKVSITPFNNRNFNHVMETSTPFITVEKRLKNNTFVEIKIHDSNPKTTKYHKVQNDEIITSLELQEVKNSEINTLVEFGQDAELKTEKFSEIHAEESQGNNINHAKAAGDSGNKILPIISINSGNNEENIQIKMISDKLEPDNTKEVTEIFANDSVKNTEKLDANLPESAEDLKLDAHFADAAAELVKFDSQADALEQKEENRRRSKTRRTGVLVNKTRRQSNKFRRQSGKFVSMAESIMKFQKGTPKRFYSTKRMMKSGHLQTTVQSSRKLICPESPILQSKSRCRFRIVSNQHEKETTEKNSAKRTGTLKKITHFASSSFGTRKNEVQNKSENRKKITTKNVAKTIPATASTSTKVKILSGEPEKMMKTKSSSPLAKIKSKSSSELVTKTTKKIGDPKSKTGEEKIASGATKKLETKTNAKSTWALSFEERNKLLLKKREDFAKRMIEQEKQMRIFHARPAPKFKPVNVHGLSTENLKIVHNNQNVKSPRTENSNNHLENQETGLHLTTVHGSSTENLKIVHNNQNVKSPKTGNSNCRLVNQGSWTHLTTVHGLPIEDLQIERNHSNIKTQSPGNSSCGLDDQENRSPLKTEERCRKRRIFDGQRKKKEEEEDAKCREEEIEQLEMMKHQENEFRKTIKFKAKPAPIFNHPQIAKSKKPLTDPQSPAWSRKFKK